MTQKKTAPVDRAALENTDTGKATAPLRYAAAGWPVVPCHWTTGERCSCGKVDCHSPGKHPLTVNGVKNASTAPGRIRSWWDRWPLANVAIATGAPGPDVLDLDDKHGRAGTQLFNRARGAGALGEPYAFVATPSGGRHAYYLGTTGGGGTVGPHRDLELKATGGYVLAPPSVVFGRSYELLTVNRESAAVVDFTAVRRVLEPPRPVVARQRVATDNFDALVRHVAGMYEGNLNNALHWAACRAAEAGAPEAVFDDLVDAAVSAGHPRPGATRTVRSARRKTGVAR